MDWKALMDQLQPLIVSACSIIVTALLGWMTAALSKRANVAKLDSATSRFQVAMTNGALSAAQTAPTATVGEVAKSALKYAHAEVPDAVRDARPSQEAQSRIAIAKATDALAKVGQMQATQRALLDGNKP